MPGRLIVIIVVFAIFFFFFTLNLENKCDISFVFKTIKDVPVYLTVFTAYVIGLFTSLPFFFFFKKKQNKEGGDKEEGSGLVFEKKNSIWAKKAANDKKKTMSENKYDIDSH
jgi:hypothetical protein